MIAGANYRARVAIRRGDWLVKPEAESLDGREVVVSAGWRLDEDETRGGIYSGEGAMILPLGAPLAWIASGDLVLLTGLRGPSR